MAGKGHVDFSGNEGRAVRFATKKNRVDALTQTRPPGIAEAFRGAA